jgi:hypothetical protein
MESFSSFEGPHDKKFAGLTKKALAERYDLYYYHAANPVFCSRRDAFSNALLVLGFRCTMCKSLAGCQEFCVDQRCNSKRTFNLVPGKEAKGLDYYCQNQHEIRQHRDLPTSADGGEFGDA